MKVLELVKSPKMLETDKIDKELTMDNELSVQGRRPKVGNKGADIKINQENDEQKEKICIIQSLFGLSGVNHSGEQLKAQAPNLGQVRCEVLQSEPQSYHHIISKAAVHLRKPENKYIYGVQKTEKEILGHENFEELPSGVEVSTRVSEEKSVNELESSSKSLKTSVEITDECKKETENDNGRFKNEGKVVSMGNISNFQLDENSVNSKNINVCSSIVRKDAEGIKNTFDDLSSVKVSALNIKLSSESESSKAVADKLGYENCPKIVNPKAEEKTKMLKSNVKVRSVKKHGKKARTKAKRSRSAVKRKRLMVRKSHLRRKCFVKKSAVKRNLSRRKKTIVARRKKNKLSLLSLSKKKRRVSIGKGSTSRKRQKSSMQSRKPFILRTGYSNRSEDKALKKIGATILTYVDPKVTHICMDKFRTTKKGSLRIGLLQACSFKQMAVQLRKEW